LKRSTKKANRKQTQKPATPCEEPGTDPLQPKFRISARDLVAALALMCITLLAYWPALHGSLLWDDRSHVTRPDLQSFAGLSRIWFDLGATQQYYPLLHSAFWLEHHLWADAVFGYHLANAVLHAISALLVVCIMRRLNLSGTWLGGLIFAVHPVNVEAVAWISEQKSTLSTVFYLGAAFVYLGYDRSRRRNQYLTALGLFILALMTKTVTASLPAALLAVFWWQRGCLESKRDIRPLLPFFALGATAGIFTAWVERTYIGATGSEYALSIPDRLLIAGRVLWFYPSKVILPIGLTFIYPRWNVDALVWWQYLFPMGVIAIAMALWRLAPRNRGPFAALVFIAVTLFPVMGFLNVFPFRYSFVADHFQYVACLGLIVPAAVLLAKVAARIPESLCQATSIAAGAALICTLGALTWAQSGSYRDSVTLYTTTLARNPGAWMAHNNLGEDLAKSGHTAEAVSHYEAALRIRPDAPEPNNNLGNILAKEPGRLQDAIEHFRTALRVKPNYADAHTNLGNALLSEPGHLEDAIREQETALALNPDLAEAHYNLANALRLTPGDLPEAVAQYQEALRLQPDFLDAHLNLGSTLSQIPSRANEALAELNEAVRLNPSYPEAHYDRGMVLAATEGGRKQAISELETAIRLKPDYVEAHANLGMVLLSDPSRTSDAIRELETAVKLDPDLPEAHYMLGAGVSGIPARLPQAIAEFQSALRLRRNYADAHYGLCNALGHSGRIQEAITECQEALRLQPDLPATRDLLDRLRGIRTAPR
jgi:protein O-mannosyl-transferase